MTTLGKRLLAAREVANVGRDEAARRIGKAGASTISNWENDIGVPSIADVARLAEVYNIDPRTLAFEPSPGLSEPLANYHVKSAAAEMAVLMGILSVAVERGTITGEEMHALCVIARRITRR